MYHIVIQCQEWNHAWDALSFCFKKLAHIVKPYWIWLLSFHDAQCWLIVDCCIFLVVTRTTYLHIPYVEKVQNIAINLDMHIVLFNLCNTKEVQVICYKFLRKQNTKYTHISSMFLRNKIPNDEFFLRIFSCVDTAGTWQTGLAVERKRLCHPATNSGKINHHVINIIKTWTNSL